MLCEYAADAVLDFSLQARSVGSVGIESGHSSVDFWCWAPYEALLLEEAVECLYAFAHRCEVAGWFITLIGALRYFYKHLIAFMYRCFVCRLLCVD